MAQEILLSPYPTWHLCMTQQAEHACLLEKPFSWLLRYHTFRFISNVFITHSLTFTSVFFFFLIGSMLNFKKNEIDLKTMSLKIFYCLCYYSCPPSPLQTAPPYFHSQYPHCWPCPQVLHIHSLTNPSSALHQRGRGRWALVEINYLNVNHQPV